MKKLLSLFLALLMIMSIALVACNDETPNDGEDTDDLAFNQTEPDENDSENNNDNNDNNDNSNKDNNDNTDNTPDDYTFTDVDETVYVQNCERVNIRTSPSDVNSNNVAGSLTFGDGKSYKRTGYNAKWSRLEINGETFYIKTYFLTTSSAETVFTTLSDPRTVYVNNVQEDGSFGNLNIRKYPTLNPDPEYDEKGNIAKVVKHGAMLQIIAISKNEECYKVKVEIANEDGTYETVIGYVWKSRFLSDTIPTGEPQTQPPETEPALG